MQHFFGIKCVILVFKSQPTQTEAPLIKITYNGQNCKRTCRYIRNKFCTNNNTFYIDKNTILRVDAIIKIAEFRISDGKISKLIHLANN